MAEYREVSPSPRLASMVECFWTLEPAANELPHRVMPDGCADILVTRDAASASLDAVGPMTCYRDFSLSATRPVAGVRFHPGMWTAVLGVPGDRLTDETIPLDALWGERAAELRDRVGESESPADWVRVLEESLPDPPATGPVERAFAWMRERNGCLSMDELADQAGWSARQFRRICLARTGLSPKFLARVLRFRNALCRVHAHPCAFARLAQDCGYYDQAHFIHEFRELSGRTPAAMPDGRNLQAR